MKNKTLHDYLREWLLNYLPNRRCFSEKTINSYKQSIIQFKNWIYTNKQVRFEDFTFDIFKKDNVYDFLLHLKNEKSLSTNTLNLRLASIKSFLKYCGEEDIELYSYYVSIKKIHNFKGTKNNRIEYLNEEHLKRLFAHPDVGLSKGQRNQFMMIFMYETGVRVSELVNIKVKDIDFSHNVTRVRILGKGNKVRYVPLPSDVNKHLDIYLKRFHKENDLNEFLFYTKHEHRKTQMSPGSVDSFLKKYAKEIHSIDSSFPLNLHAHMLRHSIAMAMYKKGIPISYIKDFLGHTNLETTAIYSYADDETIKNSLEQVKTELPSPTAGKVKKWKGREKDLLKYCGLE